MPLSPQAYQCTPVLGQSTSQRCLLFFRARCTYLEMSFSKTCSNIKLEGSKLSASCRTSSGGTKSSSLDLNDYIGNTDGFFDITCTNYSTSGARNISLVSRVILSGEFATSDGQFTRMTRLNLDNFVRNNSGSLAWVVP